MRDTRSETVVQPPDPAVRPFRVPARAANNPSAIRERAHALPVDTRDHEQELQSLREENELLRRSALMFADLADRLNHALRTTTGSAARSGEVGDRPV